MPAVRPHSRLKTLWSAHRKFYESFEKPEFDRARAGYKGRFGDRKAVGGVYATKNLIYAVADSAVASLVGSNPTVAPMPRNAQAMRTMMQAQGLMDWVFDVNKMRRRIATTLLDAVLCKRGIFKTGWDAASDRPVIRAVDPSRLFYDLTARDPDDISYFMEATVVPWSVLQARVASGRYRMPPNLQPDSYPGWMFDQGGWDQAERVRAAGAWASIIEFYDRESGKVIHYSDQQDEVLFESTSSYIPYDIYVLNQSGTDCLGLSEVQLILDQQSTINDMLTLLKRISYLQIPRVLFDKGRVTGEDLNKAVASNVGAFVGLRLKNPELGRNLAAAFFQMPYPEHPEGVSALKTMMEDDAAFISALAKSARGEIGNARTATEMAIIEAQLKMRLSSRDGNLNDGVSGAGSRAFWLAQKYMRQSKFIRLAGSRWGEINSRTLTDVQMDWRMVAHNPIRNNPAVMMETILKLLPALQAASNVDQLRLIEEIVGLAGISSRILIPEDEARAAMAAAAQAEAARAMGGAAGAGMSNAAPEEQMPPEDAEALRAASDAEGEGIPGADDGLWEQMARDNFGLQAA